VVWVPILLGPDWRVCGAGSEGGALFRMTLILNMADLIKYAATPPIQPKQCILTEYFNSYN
jgi:hypothetical protein